MFGPFIIGGDGSPVSAAAISYDPTASGIEAATVQEAMDKAISMAEDAQNAGNDAMPKSGGAFTGAVTAANGQEYAAYQIRNAAILPAVPSGMDNGAVAYVYS